MKELDIKLGFVQFLKGVAVLEGILSQMMTMIWRLGLTEGKWPQLSMLEWWGTGAERRPRGWQTTEKMGEEGAGAEVWRLLGAVVPDSSK